MLIFSQKYSFLDDLWSLITDAISDNDDKDVKKWRWQWWQQWLRNHDENENENDDDYDDEDDDSWNVRLFSVKNTLTVCYFWCDKSDSVRLKYASHHVLTHTLLMTFVE